MTTLKDQSVVNAFADRVARTVYSSWRTLTARRRAELLHSAVAAGLTSCSVEPTQLSMDVTPGNDGQFQFSDWKIAVNPTMLAVDTVERNSFIRVAGTFYHEARHCEQWWHMARLSAMTEKSFVRMAEKLGISKIAAGVAFTKKMSYQYDPMRASAEQWYQSVYGSRGDQREVVLHVLYLRRTGNDQAMHGFHNGAHQRYSGNLPEESDAFEVEKLVTDRLTKILLPPPVPSRTGRPPRPQ